MCIKLCQLSTTCSWKFGASCLLWLSFRSAPLQVLVSLRDLASLVILLSLLAFVFLHGFLVERHHDSSFYVV